ncbi:pleckstrin homology domain-containing family J member 1-like [Ptychodera flava]|uniref:pleckstrin homology domain-containing family J member 1-like n=1 Tax=Ptychodera flava TaxID=63121 RepID=UPI003969F5C3
MRFNEKELSMLAYGTADFESRLLHKPPGSNLKFREVYRERWCKLKGNFLFYCRTNETGECQEPIGALLIERCKVQHEHTVDKSFAFSISYPDDGDRKHYFVGASDKQTEQWVMALTQASYENLQTNLAVLRAKLKKLTGEDPLQSKPILSLKQQQLSRTMRGYAAETPQVAN